MNELKKRAFEGVVWGSGRYIFNQVVLLIVKLVLVRLLIPEEFGLAAMAYILISSLSIINAFGTGTAFVRDNKSDPVRARNTLFYLDATAITLIGVLGLFLAPYGVLFFGKNITDTGSLNTLLWMFRLVALTQFLNIFTIVPDAMLTKELKFKQTVIAGIFGTVVYAVIAVVLAYMGFGAWAIILAQIASGIVGKIFIFYFYPFIPSLLFDIKIAKAYLKFGVNAFVNSIIGVIIDNGDDALVGRLIGAAALGFYSLGAHFAGMIVSIISGVIDGVMFPVLSKLQQDKEMFVKAFFKAYRLRNMFALPSIGGAVVLAPWIVFLIFGEKWMPIIPVFYILSLASLIGLFIALGGPVLNCMNKPHILRNNKLIQFGFYIVLIYPFVKYFGLVGVSWVMVIFALVSIVHLTPYIAKEIPDFYSRSVKILLKPLACTLFMMIVVHTIRRMFSPGFIMMFLLVGLGIILYFVPMWFLDKEELRWDIQETMTILRGKFKFLR